MVTISDITYVLQIYQSNSRGPSGHKNLGQSVSRAAPVTLLANQINNIIQSEVVAEVKFNV